MLSFEGYLISNLSVYTYGYFPALALGLNFVKYYLSVSKLSKICLKEINSETI